MPLKVIPRSEAEHLKCPDCLSFLIVHPEVQQIALMADGHIWEQATIGQFTEGAKKGMLID
jgi:hypothetical protein